MPDTLLHKVAGPSFHEKFPAVFTSFYRPELLVMDHCIRKGDLRLCSLLIRSFHLILLSWTRHLWNSELTVPRFCQTAPFTT
jgi:hypothetical protein